MSILIKNVHLVTGDADKMYAGTGNILIQHDRIAYIGREEREADVIMDRRGMIAMPGLINAHTHSPMVLMRNAADDLPLERWLNESIFPVEKKLTREHIHNGTMLALVEMIRGGTTAFLDMYFDVETTAEAVLQAGIRANLSYGLLTCHQLENGLEAAREACKGFRERYHGAGNGLLHTSLEVHSVYLYDEKLLEEAVRLSGEMGSMIHIHLHETKTEVENSIKTYGRTPISQCEKNGMLKGRVTAAHTVWVEGEDMDILKQYGVVPVHNPSSNMKLGSGFAPVPEMIRKGICPALGTDGAASNNDLDMFCEMHLAGLIHKGAGLDATLMNAATVIGMATGNGARALGFTDIGMLKEGCKADLILVDTDAPHLTPLLDPVAALVYSTKASDVDTVIIDGKILMEKKELKTLDQERIMYQARKSARELTGKEPG
ncbi:MAG: amidohydrolase [Clostridia bacterium]